MPRSKKSHAQPRVLTEQDYVDHLEKVLWKGETPISPFDPTSKVYLCADQKTKGDNPVKYKRYKCKNTGEYFNVKTGTIFENSKLPLWKWFYAIQMFSNHKRGIAAHQLARAKDIGVDIKTSWFIEHRLRHASDNIPLFKKMLKGFVEADETFIGGKEKNKHWDKKIPNSQGRSQKGKTSVLVMVERKGSAIAQVVPNTQQKTLEPIIEVNVEKGSNVFTDEWLAYNDLGKWYNHDIVNHGKKQYAKGKVSVNTAESFNACLKKTINGTYIHISKKHSQKYVNECVFRFNTRKYSEEERFDLLLASTAGKRLTYKELIHG